MRKINRLSREDAEAIAISGLQFLVENPDALGRFLALTGIGPGDIRAAAQEPGFLTGVLEFYLEDESLLLAFAASQSIRPMLIAAARLVLSPEDGDFS